MRISEIHRSALLETITGISVDELGIAGMMDRADDDLSGPAADAIDRFVGMVPGAKKTGIWGGIMQARQLEDAYSDQPSEHGLRIRRQLDAAFRPIRDYLHARYGNSITLYRTQEPISGGKPRRYTLSWTSDYRVAADVAGVDPRLLSLRPVTEDEISRVLSAYQTTGHVKWRGKQYVRTSVPTDDPSLDKFYYDILDRDGDHITDGDDIKASLLSVRDGVNDIIRARDTRLGHIMTAEIPIDSIIWITDRAGQSEFILRNSPSSVGYLDPQGRMKAQ